LYALVATSFFMSLMFPTIYGIALEGLGEDAKLGSAGLVMAIVGGALMPPMQGALIDMGGFAGFSGENFSFVLPLICFVVIAVYARSTMKMVR
jgi:FHS family L-fucose permease-like MFS transporter